MPFQRPTPAHLPRPPRDRPFVLGHRGARAKVHENTMRAFEHALSDGADGVEVDVRMTSDGALVIGHDEDLSFDGQFHPLPLYRLTSSQLAALRLSSGDRVPTLSDALRLQASTGCLVNVELKHDVPNPSWMATRAAEEIRIHGGSGIVVSSFSPVLVRKVAQLLPHVPTALLISARQKWMRRLLPIRWTHAGGVHPQEMCLDEELMTRLRSKCGFVGAWTVNDTARAKELAALGVDLLIGDDPGALLTALRSART